MEPTCTDPCILNLPTSRVLKFLEQSDTMQGGGTAFALKALQQTTLPADWHRLFRTGMQTPLHLNLGIPGIEEPDSPIEENAACLAIAILLGTPTLPVILSGELERAQEAGLLDRKAMSNLRNRIRVSI